MNKVQLIGRVTKEIDLRTTQSGKYVVKFTLAVSRRAKDEADFISCIAWDKKAEIMEKYVRKGDRIGIVGRMQTGSYEKDGHKVFTTDIIVEDLEFLQTKQETNGKINVGYDDSGDFAPTSDEDLPF